jgi:hypothetical protein
MQTTLLIPLLVSLSLVSLSLGYPNYAGTCVPGLTNTGGTHNNPTTADGQATLTLSDANGNKVTQYAGGAKHTVTFTTQNANNGVGGFVMWAEDANGKYVGSWTPATGQQTQDNIGGSLNAQCPGKTALGHNGGQGGKKTITGTWTADNGATGNLIFKFINVPANNKKGATLNTQMFAQQPGTVTPPPPPPATPPAGTPPAGTPPAGTPPAGTPPAGAPVNNQNAQGVPATNAPALSPGALAGIIIGVVLGVLLIAAVVLPVVYAVVRKDDPRVQRFTQTFNRR